MSHDSAPRSHVMPWIACALAVLLLYAASWPVVEIKMTTRLGRGRSSLVITPRWVGVVYRPMRLLASTPWGHDPLSAYYLWWQKVLI
jgi:hypothetical protein